MKNLMGMLLCVFISGCGAKAYLVTEQDPAYAPKKSDPLVAFVSNQSTIRERQILPILVKQLADNGFTVTNEVKSAKWVLGLAYDSETFVTGSTSRGASIPIGGVSIEKSKTTVDYETKGTIHLWLFPAADYFAGKELAIWSGTGTADRDVISEYSEIIVKDLLEAYGQNYEDERMMRFQKPK